MKPLPLKVIKVDKTRGWINMKANLNLNPLTAIKVGESFYYTAPIPGCDGYLASSCGEIISLISGRSKPGSALYYEPIVLKSRGSKGYLRIDIYQDGKVRSHRVHRLVASAFFDAPDVYFDGSYNEVERSQVNHIDGDKTNNAVSNLEWCSRSENMSHYHGIIKTA